MQQRWEPIERSGLELLYVGEDIRAIVHEAHFMWCVSLCHPRRESEWFNNHDEAKTYAEEQCKA